MDLTRLGLWSPSVKNELVAANGSVADLSIPDDLKALYRTVWEIKQRALVDMAAGRGAFIDQSQASWRGLDAGGGGWGARAAPGWGGGAWPRPTLHPPPPPPPPPGTRPPPRPPQSFNVHMPDPNFGKLTSLHFYAWKAGLKTGMYYLRTRAAADAIKFTVDQQAGGWGGGAAEGGRRGRAGGGGWAVAAAAAPKSPTP